MTMNRRTLLVSGACTLAMPSIAQAGGGEGRVNAVQIIKSKRRLDLLSGTRVLKTYPVHLGKVPQGPKAFEGDNRTPEGVYTIQARVPNSSYFKSLAISYPNRADMRRAQQYGRSPGGNICLHGQPNGVRHVLPGDWTAGCIALSNADMDEIYRYVMVGTPIRIYA